MVSFIADTDSLMETYIVISYTHLCYVIKKEGKKEEEKKREKKAQTHRKTLLLCDVTASFCHFTL